MATSPAIGQTVVSASPTIDETTTAVAPAADERRLSPRFECDGFAEVFVPETGYLFRGQIRDISQSGCRVATRVAVRLERLTEVEVLFRLKGREYRIPASVMNVRPGQGVGLSFSSQTLKPAESVRNSIQLLIDKMAHGQL